MTDGPYSLNARYLHRLAGILILALALPFSGAVNGAERAGRTAGIPDSQLIRAAAEVLAIDPATRTLTLRREDGNTLTVVADKRIGNLSLVRVGDIVIARYGHARALSLRKARPGESEAATESASRPPARPPVGGLGRRTLIGDIIAIDDRTRQATLKGLSGEVVDVVFARRHSLASVRIGDRVRLEYTNAVAVSIKPAGSMILPKRRQDK